MTQQIGVWIDHRKAVIVDVGQAEPRTIASDLEPHTRFVGGSGHPGGQSSLSAGSERRYEARTGGELKRYLDAVLAAIGQPRELFIFGPGETKQHLETRLGETARPPRTTVALETADKLTDPQIVATVLEHFQGHAT